MRRKPGNALRNWKSRISNKERVTHLSESLSFLLVCREILDPKSSASTNSATGAESTKSIPFLRRGIDEVNSLFRGLKSICGCKGIKKN